MDQSALININKVTDMKVGETMYQAEYGQSLIGLMRDSKNFLNITILLTIFFFLFTFYSPSVLAVKIEVENIYQSGSEAVAYKNQDRLAMMLDKFRRAVAKEKQLTDERYAKEVTLWSYFLNFFGYSSAEAESLESLKEINDEISELHQSAISGFEKTGNYLIERNVSPEILREHSETVAQYNALYEKLEDDYRKLLSARTLIDQVPQLESLESTLKGSKFGKSYEPFNPEVLPFGASKQSARKLIETKEGLNEFLSVNNESNDFSAHMINAFVGQAHAQSAQENLAETMDARITQEIKDLAQSLDYDPIKIYSWVHDNIYFIPSYGSIQGSLMTMQLRQGNAFDTASLLIALLRASNIPARYAYGVINVPSANIMNWVGGVDSPLVAQQILGQGGIPNVAVVNAGKIASIKLEHVWVEAWVDFEPSRAAKNIQGDSWVPLDASYKQYDVQTGLDVASNVPFDGQDLLDRLANSAAINNGEGSIQGLDQSLINNDLNDYISVVNAYIANNTSAAQVAEVFDFSKVKIIPIKVLPASLPNDQVLLQQSFSEIPDQLRYKFKYELSLDSFGAGNKIFTVVKNTVELAGKKITLSFRPASQSDVAFIRRLVPEAGSDGVVDISKLPKRIPGYLIKLKPEFAIDDEIVVSGAAVAMGTEMSSTMGYWSPSEGWQTSQNNPIAGEFVAIGLDLQGVSEQQLTVAKEQLNDVKLKVEAGNAAEVDEIKFVGDLLYSAILNYFAVNNVQDQVSARAFDTLTYRSPSYGVFMSQVSTVYWFGIPRYVERSGLSMDVDRVSNLAVHKGGDPVIATNFVKAIGARYSAMEHIIPEQMFSDPNNPSFGVSAVKALSIAASEGQKIYRITSSNLSTVLSQINIEDEVRKEVVAGVNAGHEVIISQGEISVGRWNGIGYLIIDPDTGAGAYKISGGANGGVLDWAQENADVLGFVAFAAGLLSILASGWFFALLIIIAVVLAVLVALASYLALERSLAGGPCANSGLLELYAGLLLAAVVIGALAGGVIGAVFGALLISVLSSAVPAAASNFPGCR